MGEDSVSSESSLETQLEWVPTPQMVASGHHYFNFDDYLEATYESAYQSFEQAAKMRHVMVDTYNYNPESKWQQQYL